MIVFLILFVVLTLFKLNRRSSVISVFLIFLILNYLNGQALSSVSGKCNPFHNESISKTNFVYSSLFHILISSFLAILAIISPIFTEGKSENLNTVKKQPKLDQDPTNPEKKEDVGENVETQKMVNTITYDVEDPDFNAGNENPRRQLMIDGLSFLYFHLAMIFFSFYVGKSFFE